MAKESVIQRSFGAGELAPALHARADQVKYVTGLRRCKNFIVRKAGGVSNRSGLRYIATAKTNSAATMLMPYFSELAGESVLIEVGIGYMRFFVNGARVQLAGNAPAWNGATNYVIGDLAESGGVNYYAKLAHINQAPPNATYWHPLTGLIYEVSHPFGANLFQWSQSGRTITLTDADFPPHEMVFETLTRWIVRPIETAPDIDAPANLVLTPGGAGGLTYGYVVTAGKAETYEESVASGQAIAAGVAAPTDVAPHVLTWDALVPPPAEYYVYGDPYANGIYGLIGIASTNSFRDIGFEPDFSLTPPIVRNPFDVATKYPRVAATHQQRRLFGHTKEIPDAIWGSRIGFPSNFSISSPLQDDDAISFRIAGNLNHPIRHMLSLKAGLVVLTDGGEWTVRGDQNGALTPSSINPDQETYAGAYKTRPVIVGNSILYVQARGSIIRDLQFDQEVEGLAGRDLTVYSDHLVKTYQIRDLDFAQDPDSIVWAVRSDGTLLGLTYLREHDVWGWHRHTIDGIFWDVCCLPEATRDAPYFLTYRVIDGATECYIERLESRDLREGFFDEDCFFVDCGLSYSGAPANNVSGLGHLEGERVAIVGDGAVISDGVNGTAYTVTGAGNLSSNLPASYSEIHVGLPILYPEIETLSLDVQGASIRDKKKRVVALTAIVERSARTFSAGTALGETLRKIQLGPHEQPSAEEFTGNVDLTINSHFNEEGRVFIRHTDPLPLTILGLVPTFDS